jgi:hypothetical protein
MSSRYLNMVSPVNWLNPLNRGLLGRWKAIPGLMGGSRFVDLCNRNPGTLTTATWASALNRSGGMGSVGKDSSDGPNVNLGVSSFGLGIRRNATFAGWIRSNGATTAGGPVVISDWNSNNGFILRLDNTFAPSGLTFYVYPNNHRINVSAGVAANTWAHLVGVMDGANTYAYINGVQVGTTTLGEDIGSSASPLRLLFRGDLGTTQTGPGNVDDVAIWNRSLSAPEVAALYNATRREYDPTLNWIRKRSYATAGGAAFKPYWALRRAQVIGGGNH